MAPKNKQKKKNGFGIFLDDYVRNQRLAGRNISHRIGAEECALIWEKMTQDEKQVYTKRASNNQVYAKKESETKFTSIGISYAELEEKQQEAMKKIERANNEISSTIANFNWDTIRQHLFYTIHCHFVVKLEDGIYVPGEIAICEFSLESGIRRSYHKLINPGPLPIGYGYQAKIRRETIHNLPIPSIEEGVSDYFEVLNEILAFIEPGRGSTGKCPPFYAVEEDIPSIENILKQFSNKLTASENYFRVYPMHKMFFTLKNKCVELAGDPLSSFPVLTNASMEIERDVYRYVCGISCKYHTPFDDFYHTCSLSVAQRYVYLICDHCCQYLKIRLIPGKHIRANADIKDEDEETFLEPKTQLKREKLYW